jgi:hypothetical protein
VRRPRPSATKRPPALGVLRETWSVPCVQLDERPKLCEGPALETGARARRTWRKSRDLRTTTRTLLMDKCRSRADNKANSTLRPANSLRKDHQSRHLRVIHAIHPFHYQCGRFPIHPPKKHRSTCRSRRRLHTSDIIIAVRCRRRPRWSHIRLLHRLTGSLVS